MQCTGLHKYLLVEEWTGMGANCACLTCNKTFHMDLNTLEERYLPFQHFSGIEGLRGDMTVMILAKELRR